MKKLWALYFVLIVMIIVTIAYADTSQRGFIGSEDFKLWTGDESLTFTRKTSSGGTQTLSKVGVVVNAIATHGDGTSYTWATLNSAINESTTTRAILISPGTWAITGDLTVPSYIALIFPPGAIMDITATKTLTIEGHVDAGEYQIFSGDGTVTFTGVQLEHDMWKDGAGNDIYPSTDNSIDLGGSSNEFKDGYFDGKIYSDAIQMDGGKIDLDADEDTSIQSGTDDIIDFEVSGADQVKITDGTFEPETDSDIDLGSSSKYFETTYTDNLNVSAGIVAPVQYVYFQRASFTHSDDDTMLISAGTYNHSGTTTQTVYWSSEITFDFGGAAGSNEDSDEIDEGAFDVHYIFLDDSAIVNQASPLLDKDCFLNSKTAPSWSHTKHGWYSGSDRCIFAVTTDSDDDILPWNHDGGTYVQYEAMVEDQAASADIDDTLTDVTLSIPAFGDNAQAMVIIRGVYAAAVNAGDVYWRKNGDTSTHIVGNASGSSTHCTALVRVTVDSSQIIEVAFENAGNCTLAVNTIGYFLPKGM